MNNHNFNELSIKWTPKLNHSLHSSQSHSLLRDWTCKGNSNFSPGDFILPLFVIPNDDATEEIPSMPGVYRRGIRATLDFLEPLVQNFALKSVLLFPVLNPESKSIENATDETMNPVLRLIPVLKSKFPDLLLIVDVCLCGFNPTGHCCTFDEVTGQMDNEWSLMELDNIALAYAMVGTDVIAPSDMMDSRIGSIRAKLNQHKLNHVSIMAYSAKFSSCLYGPFRDAAHSAPSFGDRKKYQLPVGSSGLAMRAIARDVEEGADVIMVKPGSLYLDIVKEASVSFPNLPLAVYHVSGEYSMLHLAAEKGTLNLKEGVKEVMICFKRAGAGIVITYFTPQILEWIKNGEF